MPKLKVSLLTALQIANKNFGQQVVKKTPITGSQFTISHPSLTEPWSYIRGKSKRKNSS